MTHAAFHGQSCMHALVSRTARDNSGFVTVAVSPPGLVALPCSCPHDLPHAPDSVQLTSWQAP